MSPPTSSSTTTMSSLQELPPELLAKVLLLNDAVDFCSFSLVNQTLRQICIGLAPIVYNSALQSAGMVDRSKIPSAATLPASRPAETGFMALRKLNALIEHEEAWVNLRFRGKYKFDLVHGIDLSRRRLMQLTDGVLLLTEEDDFHDSITYFDLLELRVVRGKVYPGRRDRSLRDMAVSLRDFDLIVVLDTSWRTLHFLRLSTGNPHPLAQNPCKPLPYVDAWHGSDRLWLCGQQLLMRRTIDANYRRNLLLFNWYRGELLATFELREHVDCDFVFVTHDILLSVSYEGWLRFLRLSVDDEPNKPRRVEELLHLRLPVLKRRYLYSDRVRCSSKPDLFGEANPDHWLRIASLKKWGGKSPFVCSPEDALIRVFLPLEIKGTSYSGGWFTLLVHRRSLVELVERFPPEPAQDSPAMPQVLQWEDWGPPITHLCEKGVTHNSVVGQRLVIESRSKIVLRDFNVDNVKRHRDRSKLVVAKHADDVPSATSPHAGPTIAPTSISVIEDSRTLTEQDIFEHNVQFSLPYVESVREGKYRHLQDVLLGEDCLIGIHRDEDGDSDVLHKIDIHSIPG